MKINVLKDWLQSAPLDGQKAIILIRMMAGGVFLWEGILKFVYVNQGVGRFTKLGFFAPELTAHAVGMLEIVGGLFIILGFLTRWTAVPFIVEMLMAMLVTKVSLYFGTSPLPLPSSPPQVGAWAVLHEIRSEYAQLLSMMFLAACGPGVWSIDAWLAKRNFSETAKAMTFQKEKMKAALLVAFFVSVTTYEKQLFASSKSFSVSCEGQDVALRAEDRSVCGNRQDNIIKEVFKEYSTVLLGFKSRCSFPGLFDDQIQLSHIRDLRKFVLLGPLSGEEKSFGTSIHVREAPFDFSYQDEVGSLVRCRVVED